jgi:hypothetical protein
VKSPQGSAHWACEWWSMVGLEGVRAAWCEAASPRPSHDLFVRAVSLAVVKLKLDQVLRNTLANDFFFLKPGVLGESSAGPGEAHCEWWTKSMLVGLRFISCLSLTRLTCACHEPRRISREGSPFLEDVRCC